MRVIEGWDIVVLLFDKPVIRHEYSRDGGQEDGVPVHEGQESGGTRQNLPRDQYPSSDQSRNHASSPNVDPSWEEDSQIIGSRDGISGNVCPNLCDIPCKGGKEGGASPTGSVIQPKGDDVQWVPEVFSSKDHSAGCCDNSENAADREDDGEEW